MEVSKAQMSVVLVGQKDASKSRREELGCSIQPVSHRHALGTRVGVVAALRICYCTPRQATLEVAEQGGGFSDYGCPELRSHLEKGERLSRMEVKEGCEAQRCEGRVR